MESAIIFSSTDNSIDIAGAFIFCLAFGHSLRYLCLNHLNEQGRIIYIFIITIAFFHIVQVIMQLIVGQSTVYSMRLWDMINYVTAVLFLMAAHRIYKKEKK